MIRMIIAAFVLAACGNPDNKCPQHGGTDVSFGSACVFAPHAIAIDGDFSDWADVPSDRPLIGGGSNDVSGEVQGVHATLTPDGNVAMYLETLGAPLDVATNRYHVELFPLDGPSYLLALELQPAADFVDLGVNTLHGFPLEVAFGATGIELAMPISALPFGGGLAIETATLQRRVGTWNTAQLEVPAVVYVCWDKHSPLCLPSYAPPTQ